MRRRRDPKTFGFEEKGALRAKNILEEEAQSTALRAQKNKSRFKQLSSSSIELINLPNDILYIIIQKTNLLERHILRFVSKKLHHLVHYVSGSLLTHFYYPKGGLDALAAKCGNISVFKWIISIFKRGNARSASIKVWYNAAKYGNIEMMKYIKYLNYPSGASECIGATKGGNFENLIWAFENGCPLDKDICSFAALEGHFKILKWARENRCCWDGETCSYAAFGGHFEILKWAREKNCPWNEETCSNAAYSGHLEILKWAIKNGCPCDERTRLKAALR
jgi:hypothetical protein